MVPSLDLTEKKLTFVSLKVYRALV